MCIICAPYDYYCYAAVLLACIDIHEVYVRERGVVVGECYEQKDDIVHIIKTFDTYIYIYTYVRRGKCHTMHTPYIYSVLYLYPKAFDAAV